MFESEKLVYLDVQRTGSDFVVAFLQRFLASSNGCVYRSRKLISERKEGALHIISCRHPLGQYLSLYSFGCDGQGAFYKRMHHAGLASLYDGSTGGFAGWLELILAPEHSERLALGRFNNHPLQELFGFQTFRFLRLALPGYVKASKQIKTESDVREHLLNFGMMDVVLRQETLNEDLCKLVSGEHAHLFENRDGVPHYLAETPRTNTSTKRTIDLQALTPEILSALRAREWLLYDILGYQ